jgi:hypothetical protein
MKIIASDIVLGLQEQERKCGSEAIQIHPNSRTGVTSNTSQKDCICNVYQFVQYPIETSFVCRHVKFNRMHYSRLESQSRAEQSRAEKHLSDFPII